MAMGRSGKTIELNLSLENHEMKLIQGWEATRLLMAGVPIPAQAENQISDFPAVPDAEPEVLSEPQLEPVPVEYGHNFRSSKPLKFVASALAAFSLAGAIKPLGSADAAIHIINSDPRNVSRWDTLSEVGETLVSNENPGPGTRWAQRISTGWYTPEQGGNIADRVHQILASENPPESVMIDELRSDSKVMLADFVDKMASDYPQHNGKWGIYVVNGEGVSYQGLTRILVPAMRANAKIALEFYPKATQYLAWGKGNVGQSDVLLNNYMMGSGSAGPNKLPRLNYLWNLRTRLGSSSPIIPIFPVDKNFANTRYPEQFVDRMFYVFATRSKKRFILREWCAGSWKFDLPKVASPSLDKHFAFSMKHYCTDGKTTSRLGKVAR